MLLRAKEGRGGRAKTTFINARWKGKEGGEGAEMFRKKKKKTRPNADNS